MVNLAAISHIKKLISLRPQIIRTLIFYSSQYLGKHVTGRSSATFFHFQFIIYPCETLKSH